MQEVRSSAQEAEAHELAQAIAAAETDLLEVARTLVGSTPSTLFGKNESKIHDIILRRGRARPRGPRGPRRAGVVEGGVHVRLSGQLVAEAGRVRGVKGAEFAVTVRHAGDGARGQGQPTPDRLLVDLRGGAVVGVAESPDEGQDVEAELAVRQGEPALRLGRVGPQARGRPVTWQRRTRRASPRIPSSREAVRKLV